MLPSNPRWQLVDESSNPFEARCLGCGLDIIGPKYADLNGPATDGVVRVPHR